MKIRNILIIKNKKIKQIKIYKNNNELTKEKETVVLILITKIEIKLYKKIKFKITKLKIKNKKN